MKTVMEKMTITMLMKKLYSEMKKIYVDQKELEGHQKKKESLQAIGGNLQKMLYIAVQTTS